MHRRLEKSVTAAYRRWTADIGEWASTIQKEWLKTESSGEKASGRSS